jgi:vitamin B12 transporter
MARVCVERGKMKKTTLTAVLLGISYQPIAAATTPEIVVTATRLPTPVEQVGSTFTVISAEEIKRRQYKSLSEALRYVPGLNVVRSGGPGQQTSVFTRGTNSNHTLVLVDGIEVADPSTPSGTFEFANLTLDDVERIEVVRGPQSTLYGSDAIGGVINVITKKGQGDPKATMILEGGEFGTFNQVAGVSGSTGEIDYRANVSHRYTEGYSVTPSRFRAGNPVDDDGHENWNFSGQFGVFLTDTVEFRMIGRFIDSETEADLGSTEDSDSKLLSKQWFLRGELNAVLLDGDLESSIALSYADHHRKTRNERQSTLGTIQHTDFEGSKRKLEWKNDYFGFQDHIVTLGMEGEWEKSKARGRSVFGSLWGDFIITENTEESVHSKALYVQDQLNFSEQFFVTLGVRSDKHEAFDSEVTYRLVPVYLIRESGTRLKASYSTGFKAPSIYELYGVSPTNYGTTYSGNPDLKPEKSEGWELGIEQEFSYFPATLGVTYFKQDVKDLIATEFDAFFNSTSVNLDKAEIEGGELFLALPLSEHWDIRFDYTYTDARDGDGDDLLRRPMHKSSLAVTYQPRQGLDLTLAGQHLAGQTDIDRVSGTRVRMDPYTVWDFTAAYALTKQLELFGRIENLGNERYEPANGFEAPRRSAFIGIRYRAGGE